MRKITQGTLSLYTPAGARKYLTEHERTRFLSAAATFDRPEIASLCAVVAWTGCRISEALALTAGSIDRAQGFIAIRCLKKRSATPVIREVPVPNDLLDTLQRVHVLG